MSDQTLAQIEAKLDKLLQCYAELKLENTTLRQKETLWLQERGRLLEKNELARARIQNMLQRLKQIEMDVQQ